MESRHRQRPSLLFWSSIALGVVLLLAVRSDASVSVYVNPQTGVDGPQNSCANSSTPCASLVGAINAIPLAVNGSDDATVELVLQAGSYTGTDNYNVTIPSIVSSIVGVGETTSDVQILGAIYGDGHSGSSIFNIGSSVSISNITFSGTFVSPFTTVPVISIDSNSNNAAVTLSNIVLWNLTCVEFINAQVSQGSSIVLTNVNVESVLPPPSSWTLSRFILASVASSDPTTSICSSNYTSPQVDFSSIVASGSFEIESLLVAQDVAVSIANTNFASMNVYSVLISASSSCAPQSPQKPSISISDSNWSNLYFETGNAIQSNLGATSIVNFTTNFMTTSSSNEAPLMTVQNPTSLLLSGIVVQNGSLFSGGILLGWSCVDALSCSTLLNNNVLSSLSILNNSFVALQIQVSSPPQLSGNFVTVSIDNSNISWNANSVGVEMEVLSDGGAIQVEYSGSNNGSIVFVPNLNLVNTLNIQKTTFDSNAAKGGGGALSLKNFVVNIVDSQFINNTALNQFLLSDSSCPPADEAVYGGGAILAGYQTTISISNNTVFSGNSVNAALSTTVPFRMGGAILCCSGPSNVTLISDSTSVFEENDAPMVENFHCSNVTWRKPLPTCFYQGPASFCSSSPTKLPIWLMAFIMIGTCGGCATCFVLYKKRNKKRVEGYAKL